jgi:hypothetical protein
MNISHCGWISGCEDAYGFVIARNFSMQVENHPLLLQRLEDRIVWLI